MPEYAEKFKRLLMEELDITRNPADANISDEVDPDAFEVDPMSSNVGFGSMNTERDTQTLSSILSEIKSMTKNIPNLSQKIASVGRTFGEDLIYDVRKKLADVNTDLGTIVLDIVNNTEINPPQSEEPEQNQGEI